MELMTFLRVLAGDELGKGIGDELPADNHS